MVSAELKFQFRKAWDLIGAADNILLTTHEGTDGDDLGSLLAVYQVLAKANKRLTICVKEGVPHNLLFLPENELVNDLYRPGDYDLLITFGCGKLSRPGFPEVAEYSGKILNFDHHPDNSLFGTVNLVEPKTAAVAELVYYFLKSSDQVAIDKNIATCLLTGIFTDTGGFKHSNTTSEVLEAAAELMKKGARIDRISSFTIGQKRPQTIRAWSKALENTRFDKDKRMVFSVLTEEDLKDIGATDEDLSGFVELINNIPYAKFALLLRQDGELVRGSLRSEPHKRTDVSRIAHSFGGGGHKYASGFRLKGRLVKDKDSWKIEEA
ncbi:MAG: DHH family phosphoesterase [Candidatus Saccharibacteria bacterium]